MDFISLLNTSLDLNYNPQRILDEPDFQKQEVNSCFIHLGRNHTATVTEEVEMNVGWQQGKLVQFCRERKIHLSAWSPLGGHGSPWGTHAVMENPVLQQIAASKNKTLAQVALRWIYEQGATPIVRSSNRERIKQNIEIFDWELSDEEVHKIQQFPQHRACDGGELLTADSQYKSVEELWDGEI